MAILEAEGVVLLVLFLFWAWALFDCISTDAVVCRNLPKGVWLMLVLFLPDVGSLAWLLLGRPEKAGWKPGSTDYSTPTRPLGVEDHPLYGGTAEVTDRRSAELDRRLEAWELEQAKAIEPPRTDADASAAEHLDAREAELAEREADLRRRELELRERELSKRERDLDEH